LALQVRTSERPAPKKRKSNKGTAAGRKANELRSYAGRSTSSVLSSLQPSLEEHPAHGNEYATHI